MQIRNKILVLLVISCGLALIRANKVKIEVEEKDEKVQVNSNEEQPLGEYDIYKVSDYHRLQMLISWGVVSDLGLMCSRYLKYFPKLQRAYLPLHVLFFTLIFLATAISNIFMMCTWPIFDMWRTGSDTRKYYFRTHIVLGSLHFFLVTVQFFGGFLSRYLVDTKKYGIAINMLCMHRVNGVFLYLLGKVNYLVGNMTDTLLNHVAYPVLTLILFELAFMLFLELTIKMNIFGWFGHDNYMAEKQSDFRNVVASLQQQKLVQQIKANRKVIENEKEQKIRWVIYRNNILDLHGLEHPGGDYILDQVIGRSIDRFLYGSYGLEVVRPGDRHNNKSINTHSAMAMHMLAGYRIGHLDDTNNILILKNAIKQDNKDAHQNYWEHIDSIAEDWQMVRKDRIQDQESVWRYEWTNKSAHVKGQVKAMDQFGKHWEVVINNKTRLYTVCQCYSQANLNFIQRSKNYSEEEFKEQLAILEKKQESEEEGNITMVIKAYQVGGVSELLTQQDIQEHNRILGSYGRGLELSEHSEGLYTVLCAGTGVLPVLDLVYYMYTSLRLGTNKWNNFKLKLVGSFQREAEYLGQDLLETMDAYVKDNDLTCFELKLSFFERKGETKNKMTRFDQQYLTNCNLTHSQMIYVCGPPIFNSSVYQALEELQYPTQQISFI